jgi:hypothetical protein
MEFTKKARFTRAFYGGKGYLSGDETVKRWLESQQDKLLHPRFRKLKEAAKNENKLEDILSVFNTNGNDHPIIGDWMIMECSRNAAKLSNTWGQFQVSADLWKGSVQFTPGYIPLTREGKTIESPDFVEVYTVSLKDRSFFKAYQGMKENSEFEFTIHVPDDLCMKPEGRGKDKIFVADEEKTTKCVNTVLDRMCMVGLGAYRLRFGKFEYI